MNDILMFAFFFSDPVLLYIASVSKSFYFWRLESGIQGEILSIS